MGSPRLHDKGAWKARIAQGIPSLTTNVINGLRAMPPRGGCGQCTDEDLKLAVKYMVEQSK
jgi:cytochrome c5